VDNGTLKMVTSYYTVADVRQTLCYMSTCTRVFFTTSKWRPHDPPFIRLDRVPLCDRQTDGQTELL